MNMKNKLINTLLIVGTASITACSTNSTKMRSSAYDKSSSNMITPSKAKKEVSYVVSREAVVQVPQNRNKFQATVENKFKMTDANPVSTFSVDVDTASYSFLRSSINQNRMPAPNTVRVEELINYFPYNYAKPTNSKQPFKVTTSVIPTPWNKKTKLLHIGIKGLAKAKKSNANLVFLIDTSGSMSAANKLPLLVNSFKLLLSTLKSSDTISIVAYAGSAGVVLKPTKVRNKKQIMQALDNLRAGGSTAGGQGIDLAYKLAQKNYKRNAVNRVFLATDGDFNVGVSSAEELKKLIVKKRKSGIYLSVLGFGMGNYNDYAMQQLAQNGNGNAAYIDSLSEARKVLVEEASSTLFPIAKDVKIQMEFNPNVVSQYRLIGYETRSLKREDFNNDKIDAGDIGAGHTVTAIYELTFGDDVNSSVDPLRYKKTNNGSMVDEYGFLKIRYKLPSKTKSKLIKAPVRISDTYRSLNNVPLDTKFATAVAGFGQILRNSKHIKKFNYSDVIKLAVDAKGRDEYGYRAEFINLVRLAKTIKSLK